MALNEIRYKGTVYAVDGDIWTASSSWYETKALKCDSLEANSFEVTVSDSDRSITNFKKNDKVEYFRDGKRMGIFYLQTVERVGPDSYRLSGLSAVGLLMTRQHSGGIYTGQTAGEVVRDICGDIPVKVESVYESRKLYNWLPYVQPPKASARDNLAEVLFSIGAWLGVDNNGVLRVEKLWDGEASAIGPGLIHAENCVVQYTDPVSAVEITEHQWVPDSDAVTLFEGTAEQGALIVFDDPAHDLTAEGFTILESGANYAVLSAGTGTLTGQGYTHITRIVRRTVTEDAEENVVAITDAHLVSLTNSVDVANRTADYYRHRETIQVDINPLSGPPGNVVQIYHPWDKVMVSACIAERETTISGLLKSSIQALVGFKPPQPDTAEYFDERIILTGNGEWEVPEDVRAVTAVLIGGAQGGHCGYGGNPAKLKTDNHEGNILGLPYYITTKWAIGGKGGEGGYPGAGGKILQSTLDVTPGQKISFTCGVGGPGAAFDTNDRDNTPNTPGALGTNTTFGLLNSSTGASSDAGYLDPVTGEVFAPTGERGIAGGDGAGMQENVIDDNRYIPTASGSVTDEDGNVWIGGLTRLQADGRIEATDGDEQSFTGNLKDGFVGGNVGYNCGSGAAAGANGNPGNASGSFRLTYSPSSGMPKTSITVTARGSASVAGADATLVPKKPTVYGKGGRGGYGGGGDGATGISETYYGGSKSGTRNNYEGSVRTTGSNGAQGGPGGDGCIILYYRRPKAVQSGPLVTSGQKWLLDSLGRRIIV